METHMTLVTLVLAWLPVAVLFLAFAWAASGRKMPPRAGVAVVLGEALVLTLLAGLWFASLGSGGWPLVFLLIGVLVSGAERGLRSALLRSPAGPELRGFALGVVRYLVAGGVLAWSLG
jgi:hypothetical protein